MAASRPLRRTARQRSGTKPKLFLDFNPRSMALGFEVLHMSSFRALRYRRLALAQQDTAIADLLLKLADECDRGILCTAELRSAWPPRKNEQPPQVGDAKFQFEWER